MNHLKKCTVISSLISQKNVTQAGIVYLLTYLSKSGYIYNLIDMSNTINYFNAPSELYTKCDSISWMNPDSISYGDWMDFYLPSVENLHQVVLFSSQFSPDLIFHARYSYKIKKKHPYIITAVGGSALASLQPVQLEFIRQFFDYILIGHDIESLIDSIDVNRTQNSSGVIIKKVSPPSFIPDYSILKLQEMVNVYSGHGCYYGLCRFCDYPSRAYQKNYIRPPELVSRDIGDIYKFNPEVKDIVLTLDSYTHTHLLKTITEINKLGGHIPYNLMLRAESWINQNIGNKLIKSGCTDVFIGIEALDDEILRILNKGIRIDDALDKIKLLSEYVDITIGMILFIPNITEKALYSQLKRVEEILPYIHSVEPEVLSIMNGSKFAYEAYNYGIVLNATENILNDSWCFGLSQDIPWTMSDPNLMQKWLEHIQQLKKLLVTKVRAEYWDVIENLQIIP